MSDALSNQVAVVFGATGRVGPSVCYALAATGMKVVVHYFCNREKAEEIVRSIVRRGGYACTMQADVTEESSMEACVKQIIEGFGRIDAVVNHVHRDKEFTPVLVADMEWENWGSHIEAMKANFLICKHVVPYMRQQRYGRIVYISGGLSYRFFKGCSAFSAAKAGMNAFCKTLALEEGCHNITVNVVAPGKIVRPNEALTEVSGNWKELEAKQLENIPLCRFATAEDVANVVVNFVGPGSSFVTGQTVFLGGEIMPMP